MFKPVDPADPHRTLAIFDLDGTLIREDSFLPFVVGYARARHKLRPLLTLPVWVGLYTARLIPDHKAKERVLISFFRGEPSAAVAEYATVFNETWIRPRLHIPVLNRLNEHLSAGHRVVLLSASPELYVPVIGHALGIHEVICTRVRCSSGIWDGVLDGINCKGEAKLIRLREHLGVDSWPSESFAYGDSPSDFPVLRWATHGFLVGRHSELKAI